jgi:predicted secreted protein
MFIHNQHELEITMSFSRVLLFSISLSVAFTTWAHEPAVHYDHISLSASASEEVAQDQLHVTVYALVESEDAQSSASAVSRRINKALAMLNQQKDMTIQTGSFTTHPVYHKQTITRWRSRQSIEIKTDKAASLGQLLGQLQQFVQLENIRYEVSDQNRQTVENELIRAALKSFQQRANLITSSLGRETYRIVDMTISTQNHRPQPMAVRTMSARAEASVAPAIQAGTQKVQVTVNGKIEVQLK